MSKGRKRKACSADKNDELMAEFHRLRDETQPIYNNLMALTPTPIINQPDGQLLRELQLMRTEMKQIQNEMNENLEKIRSEVAEVKNNQEELKNAVTENTTTLESLKTKIESETAKIDGINEKVSKLKCQPTFREQISGKWKIINNRSGQVMSIQINDEEFIVKYKEVHRNVFAIGVTDTNGCTVFLECDKIVVSKINSRREFYLEDGKLVLLDKIPGREDKKSIYTRIGDPDPE